MTAEQSRGRTRSQPRNNADSPCNCHHDGEPSRLRNDGTPEYRENVAWLESYDAERSKNVLMVTGLDVAVSAFGVMQCLSGATLADELVARHSQWSSASSAGELAFSRRVAAQSFRHVDC